MGNCFSLPEIPAIKIKIKSNCCTTIETEIDDIDGTEPDEKNI